MLFVLEDLGLDLGTTNLDNLSFRDLIGYLDERKRVLNLKSLKLGFKSECLKSPEEWKRSVASGPDFEIGSDKLLENKCNLGDYFITPTMFVRDHLSRFFKRDPNHYKDWIVAVRKARWGKWVWSLIRLFNIKIIQTDGTPEAVKAKIRKLLDLWGAVSSGNSDSKTSDNGGGYLPLEPLEPVSPASSPAFVSKEAFHGKGPPDSSSNLADSGISSSLGHLENDGGQPIPRVSHFEVEEEIEAIRSKKKLPIIIDYHCDYPIGFNRVTKNILINPEKMAINLNKVFKVYPNYDWKKHIYRKITHEMTHKKIGEQLQAKGISLEQMMRLKSYDMLEELRVLRITPSVLEENEMVKKTLFSLSMERRFKMIAKILETTGSQIATFAVVLMKEEIEKEIPEEYKDVILKLKELYPLMETVDDIIRYSPELEKTIEESNEKYGRKTWG